MTQRIGSEVRVFAPATVANLGPGFDLLGLALSSPGDTVTARRTDEPGVRIADVRGDRGALPREAAANTAGIAAAAVLARAGLDAGIELEIDKGLPLGSGLGSSAASAAAAAVATNLLLGSPLRDAELIGPCLDAETAVSGRHADNVAPAILGGLVLVRSTDPLDVVRLPLVPGLAVAVVAPRFELPTREARAALPREVPLGAAVRQAGNLAGLISALHSGDLGLLSRSLRDVLASPAREPLIPGAAAVRRAALASGALGCSISGAGPAMFALCRSSRNAEWTGAAMRRAFRESGGLESDVFVSPADNPGARQP